MEDCIIDFNNLINMDKSAPVFVKEHDEYFDFFTPLNGMIVRAILPKLNNDMDFENRQRYINDNPNVIKVFASIEYTKKSPDEQIRQFYLENMKIPEIESELEEEVLF